jgi:V/A-type H+-transporting ATPase subunit K
MHSRPSLCALWLIPDIRIKSEKEDTMNLEKVLIAFAAALAIGLTAIATAWAQSKIGAAGAGSLAEKPELTGTIVILVAIPETMVILGFVVATMILFTVK